MYDSQNTDIQEPDAAWTVNIITTLLLSSAQLTW